MSRTASGNTSEDVAKEIVEEREIVETFQRLGLGSVGPTGYHYLSNWGGEQRTAIFEVVRTSSSSPRRA